MNFATFLNVKHSHGQGHGRSRSLLLAPAGFEYFHSHKHLFLFVVVRVKFTLSSNRFPQIFQVSKRRYEIGEACSYTGKETIIGLEGEDLSALLFQNSEL